MPPGIVDSIWMGCFRPRPPRGRLDRLARFQRRRHLGLRQGCPSIVSLPRSFFELRLADFASPAPDWAPRSRPSVSGTSPPATADGSITVTIESMPIPAICFLCAWRHLDADLSVEDRDSFPSKAAFPGPDGSCSPSPKGLSGGSCSWRRCWRPPWARLLPHAPRRPAIRCRQACRHTHLEHDASFQGFTTRGKRYPRGCVGTIEPRRKVKTGGLARISHAGEL